MKRRTVISGLGLLTGSAYLYKLTALRPESPSASHSLSSSGKLPQWEDVEALVADMSIDHDLFELVEAPGSTSDVNLTPDSSLSPTSASLSNEKVSKRQTDPAPSELEGKEVGGDGGLILPQTQTSERLPETAKEEDPRSNSDQKIASSHKSRHFNNEFHDDFVLPPEQVQIMSAVLQRLKRCQTLVGFGNFNIVSFDKCIHYARNYSQVGAFTQDELAFIDSVFNRSASEYGFLGDKVSQKLTDVIPQKDVIKVPHTGHFLYRGESEKYYQRLLNEVGPNLTLTSGIRSNVKQLYLFLSKAAASNYNLSKASRSLAPPGYSFHGIGDFDVGKKGWGWANFSDQFATTQEFKKLLDLGYVQIRYNRDNTLGVRFEPWHIKVV